MSLSATSPAPIAEVLHGLTIADPHRWLEDRASPATQHWIEEQLRHCDDYFEELSGIDALRDRVREVLNVETVDQPARVGNLCFFRRRRKDEQQASIFVRDIPTGKERLLADPSAQGPYVSVAIHRISEDGSILAYALKHGGERMEAVHFVEVESGRIWQDHLEAGYTRGVTFSSDNTGIYYCHEPETSVRESPPHEIRYHRIGDSRDHDQVLISMPRTQRSRLILISDTANLGAAFFHDKGSELKVDLYLASRTDDRLWRSIFVDKAPPYNPFLHDGRIYVLSSDDASKGQILELNSDGSEGSVIIPAWKASIGSLGLASRYLCVSYQVDCITVVHRWTWTGEFLGILPAQPEGSFTLLQSYTTTRDTLFFAHESFSERPSIYEYCETTDSWLAWEQQSVAHTEHRYRVQRVAYPSKDGTAIPMWLVALDGIKTSEYRPVILTGYGFAGVPITPRFSILVHVMLEFGCVFALPNIRGGSEFGNEWYEAARRRNRQITFDDFLAAAEWLCTNGITQPTRLAIFGGSNSGLLMGVAMTQRPELFRAVLCIAPLLDMLRYERFGNASKWREEHGSVEDPDDFRALYAYSPYHHVRDDQNYPATLFVTGDKDTQCDPAHVRKMAERLQDRTAQHHPILVDYSAERGHSPVLPLSVRVDALTHRIAFLCNELGIEMPAEEMR